MDDRVRRAMARWPDVPHLYGWLRLDERGRWWLRDSLVRNQALFDYIGRNYDVDERGCWYFQNGPQRGYVALDYTPWVLHLDNSGMLRFQTGAEARLTGTALIDDEGNLLLVTQRGPGVVAGEGLAAMIDGLRDLQGETIPLETLEQAINDQNLQALSLHWNSERVPLEFIHRADVPRRFAFNPSPTPTGH
ncbi:hypothetical protein J2T57_003995 [Natronocella acetinitrilica]|uniref:DUF2946 family protein n=1 Tax=Natronocella acetinitrilica TaxID=414046 RepID=A0AAE3KHY9_9GAMM|nr:DUF2946 family protein [Natronocella acetinitrilica]MCP1676822.1 hypothetical protein [Natronocella acetinitrilica]